MTEEYEYCRTVPRTFLKDRRMFHLYLTTDLHYQLLYHSARRFETVFTGRFNWLSKRFGVYAGFERLEMWWNKTLNFNDRVVVYQL